MESTNAIAATKPENLLTVIRDIFFFLLGFYLAPRACLDGPVPTTESKVSRDSSEKNQLFEAKISSRTTSEHRVTESGHCSFLPPCCSDFHFLLHRQIRSMLCKCFEIFIISSGRLFDSVAALINNRST
jgi:hypothetical protein